MQIIKTELVLVSEDVAHQRIDASPFSGGGYMTQRGILILETTDYWAIIQMGGDTAVTVIFRHVGKKILTIVLTDCLYCPRDATLYELPGGVGLSDNLVIGRADTLKAVFGNVGCDRVDVLFHGLSHWLS